MYIGATKTNTACLVSAASKTKARKVEYYLAPATHGAFSVFYILNMELTPLDIRNQKFSTRKLGGFDPEEVQAFLNEVAASFETLLNERADLLKTINNDKKNLEKFHEMETVLKDAVVTMQETLTETKVRANKEAELIIAEAKTRAEKEADVIRNRANELRSDIDRLKQMQISYFARLRNLMRTQEDLLNSMENEE